MDIFMEKIVAKKKGIQDYLIITGLVFAGFIVLIAVMTISFLRSLWPILAAGVIYLIYYLSTSRNVEFEYIVTNGDLDIDKIISRRKRKRIFSANCKSFDILAKYKSEHYNSEVKNIQKKIEAVSSMDSPGVYFATLNYKNERTVIFFEPDEKMLDSFKTYIPRKLFR